MNLILPEHKIPEITYNMLASEQKKVCDLTKILFLRDESDVIVILGTPGSGKITTIQSITKMFDNILHGSVICLGTTGTAASVISGATCNSTLRLPINRQVRPLQVSSLRNIQEFFAG